VLGARRASAAAASARFRTRRLQFRPGGWSRHAARRTTKERRVAFGERSWDDRRVNPRVFALIPLTGCLALFGGSGASASEVRSSTETASPKQFCKVVQNPVLATAAGLLATLLPKRFQPSASLKTVIGAVVAGCPQLARAAVKVHAAFVKRSSSAPSTATVYAPWVSLLAGSRAMDLDSGAAPAFISWSGVNASTYEEKTYAGTSVDDPLTAGSLSPWVTRVVTPGIVYRFWVRALNSAGQPLTSWVSSVRFTPKVYDTFVSLRGWRTETGKSAYAGTIMYANASDSPADVNYTADGWAVALVAPTYPAGGTANVYVDQHFVKTISFYSPTTKLGQLVFSWSWKDPVRHYITLRPRSGQITLDAGLVIAPA
jgi:hypothetical protein